ncbi:hypothetical protein D8770_27500 [Methylobacterium sp. DB1607]|nr:hypothetical protein [Methylobacterium sp. DB1607]
MFKMEFRGLDQTLSRLDAAPRQVRFALSRALNDSVEAARTTLVEETWPNSVTARNKGFIKTALTTKGMRATKDSLQSGLVDRIGNVDFVRLEKGGTKTPRGNMLAVPTSRVRRGAGGAVVRSQLPRGLDPNKVVKKGNLIFLKVGRGKSAKLQLMYKLVPQAQIKPKVPFSKTFNQRVRQEMPGAYRRRLAEALKTAR